MTKSFNIIYNWLHISECLYLVSQIRNHSIIEGANLIWIRILAQVLWLCYYIFQNVSLELFFDIFDFTLLQSLYYFNWKRLGTYVSRKKFFFEHYSDIKATKTKILYVNSVILVCYSVNSNIFCHRPDVSALFKCFSYYMTEILDIIGGLLLSIHSLFRVCFQPIMIV